MAEAAAPPVGSTGDIGYTCGRAAFDWRFNTGDLTGIRQGDSACVVLLSNSTSIEMWNQMVSAGGTAASDLFSSLAGPVIDITAEKETKNYVVSQLKNAGYVLLSAAAPELAAALQAYSKFTTAMKAIRYAAYPIFLANYKAILVGGKGCYGIVFGVHQGHPLGWISPIGRLYHYNGHTRDGVYDHAGNFRSSNLECAEQNGAHNAPGLVTARSTNHLNDLFLSGWTSRVFDNPTGAFQSIGTTSSGGGDPTDGGDDGGQIGGDGGGTIGGDDGGQGGGDQGGQGGGDQGGQGGGDQGGQGGGGDQGGQGGGDQGVGQGGGGAGAVDQPPVAQSATLTLNKNTTHGGTLAASDPDGSVVAYRLTYQSFATSDFHFTFSGTGSWSITGTGKDAHVSFQYVAVDDEGVVSAPATITIYFR